jgi:hypothetical protein
MGRDEPGDFQSPVIDEWEGHGCPRARRKWFEWSLSQDVNNLHTFAAEKKAQRKEQWST